jgi:two-component system, chemotaxis family, protein-glutamate methylesterase/glutaminase
MSAAEPHHHEGTGRRPPAAAGSGPTGPDGPQIARPTQPRTSRPAAPHASHPHEPSPSSSFRAAGLNPARYLVAIGASTGGTEALRALLTSAPADFPPVVIVQHMPAGFTAAFANRLNQASPLTVTEARGGDALIPGRAVLARGDTHLIVQRTGGAWRACYTHTLVVNRHCPSVDVLFESVAAAAGRYAIGVLLTGMGNDGARGLKLMRERGALTIAQDRASCVVWGMPKVAVEIGAAMHTARPEQVPALIQRLLRAHPAPRPAP